MIRFRITKNPLLDAIEVVVDHNYESSNSAHDARTRCPGAVVLLSLPMAVAAVRAHFFIRPIMPRIASIRARVRTRSR
jgi:hypothetical protein